MPRTILQQERYDRIQKKKHDIWRHWELFLKNQPTPQAVEKLKKEFGISQSWAYTLIREFKTNGYPPA